MHQHHITLITAQQKMSQEIATSPTSLHEVRGRVQYCMTGMNVPDAEAGEEKEKDEASTGENVPDAEAGGEKEEAPVQPSNRVDLEKMKDPVFFLYPDRNTRLSGFWLLMILSSIIATSGVAGDSVATVIGAMIVAPLMTPILGTMLGIVIGDGRNFLFCLMLVLTGAGSAILIGYLYGLASERRFDFSREQQSSRRTRAAQTYGSHWSSGNWGGGIDRSCEARYRQHNARRGYFHRARSTAFCGGVVPK